MIPFRHNRLLAGGFCVSHLHESGIILEDFAIRTHYWGLPDRLFVVN